MKLASLFTSQMVLQRAKPVPVWGWANPGDTVTVEFAGQRTSVTVAPDGTWSVSLDAMDASAEPRQLTASAETAGQRIVLDDVLVGEVWLASGQSNMQWQVCNSNNAHAECTAATHPLLRLFTVPNRALENPPAEFDGQWQPCSPETVGEFSAVAYFFGRHLLDELQVPVGMIHSSWGGTRIETWMRRDCLATDPAGQQALDEYDAYRKAPNRTAECELFQQDPEAWERAHMPADPGDDGLADGWASVDFDDSDWDSMETPSTWRKRGHEDSGVFWFRKDVDVPASWAGKDLQLSLGACDKHDTTYFNGEQVGSTGWETKDAWCTPRVYTIPAALVRPGRNVITTRIYSYIYDGGLIGPKDTMRLAPADAPDGDDFIPLCGAWTYKVACSFGIVQPSAKPLGPGNPNTPYILFESMIRPLMPAAMRGAIWYQGESNADKPEAYGRLFSRMIADWRDAFAQPDLAFHFVQLANYMARTDQPVEDGWAGLRDVQRKTLEVPNTGMAVAIDIGDAADIHPRNKQDVGKRLAYGALAQVYGKDITPAGPLYRSHAIEGDAVRIEFDCADGLKTSDGQPPKAFAIAGADGAFQFAEATIDGSNVVVRSDAVASPSAVRYAWANNPEVNLVNADNLPASPFQTD